MKVLYLDESGDHSLVKIDEQFPVFCLAGVAVEEREFRDQITRDIDALKERHFGSREVIFHSRSIRKREPPFEKLMDRYVRGRFFEDLNGLITRLPLTVIAAVILKKELKDQYSDPSNPYTIALQFVLERFLYYLDSVDDIGYLSIESRDNKANRDILVVFNGVMERGSGDGDTLFVSGERFQQRIRKIEFVTKKQNDNGHQLADLVAYPIARYALDPGRPNLAFDVVKTKIRSSSGRIEGVGLKIFPQKKVGPGYSQSPPSDS